MLTSTRLATGGAVLLATLGLAAPVLAAGEADAMCKSELLSFTERNLCKEQIAGANTKTERAAIQSRFRERIKEREEAAAKKAK
jgi:hypothetical protein